MKRLSTSGHLIDGFVNSHSFYSDLADKYHFQASLCRRKGPSVVSS